MLRAKICRNTPASLRPPQTPQCHAEKCEDIMEQPAATSFPQVQDQPRRRLLPGIPCTWQASVSCSRCIGHCSRCSPVPEVCSHRDVTPRLLQQAPELITAEVDNIQQGAAHHLPLNKAYILLLGGINVLRYWLHSYVYYHCIWLGFNMLFSCFFTEFLLFFPMESVKGCDASFGSCYYSPVYFISHSCIFFLAAILLQLCSNRCAVALVVYIFFFV